MFKKTKNIFFSFLVVCLINPVLSIDPTETPTQNVTPEPKTLNDALGEIKKLEKKTENIKDEKEKEKTKFIKDIIKLLEEKQEESMDDYIVILEKMKNTTALIKNASFSGEVKEITDDLSKLIEIVIDIEKEEARKKVSLEEWKKLSVQKLSRYFLHLINDPIKEGIDPIKDIFMKAIESDSLDYSKCLSFEDFQLIVHSLCISMSENQDNVSKSITFIKNLIRKSKISEKETLFPHYIRYPEKYSKFIQEGITHNNQFLNYHFKNKNSVDFLKEIDKIDFVETLPTTSVLDSIYKFSTLKPFKMGENTAYFGLKYIAKSFVGILILPFQLFYEYFKNTK